MEKSLLRPVRERAKYIVDTTTLSTAKLQGEIFRLFGAGEQKRGMNVSVISFGFKHGLPLEADLVFDVRFLPNPFYIDTLREQTGLDEPVRSYLFGYQQTRDFMTYLERLLDFLLPQYVEEGKTALVIAIGCTGGHHRSVTLTRVFAEYVRSLGYRVKENHRDMSRD